MITALKKGILKTCLSCLASLFLFGISITSAQQTASNSIQKIKKTTTDYRAKLPDERIYIHTDKDRYFAGDTVWLKAYVFDGTTFRASSKTQVIAIELQDDSTDVVRRESITIQNGIGFAQIYLFKPAFHEGGYTLRAYSNWMYNFGNKVTFSKRMYIGRGSKNSWLASAKLDLKNQEKKEQLNAEITLKDLDRMPVGLRNIEVMVIDSNKVLYDKKMQTSLDGKFSFQTELGQNRDIKSLRVEVMDLRKDAETQKLSIPVAVNRPQKIDLQFLPEGGRLVSGISSVIAFKAIGEHGRGIDIEGSVYDSKGNQITEFESIHKGMGTLNFQPIPGEKYTAKLSKPLDVVQVYKFPSSVKTGTSLTIENTETSDSVKVTLNASSDIFKTNTLFHLIGSARGVVCYGLLLQLKSKKTISIAKRLFPSGIATISLLKDEKPLNERTVFIDHQDQLQVSVTPHKATYGIRDSVSLAIEVKDKTGNPIVGSFSLSVTDDNQVEADIAGNHSIQTSLLLNAHLTGTVEEPGFYFNKNNPQRWQTLDHVLLTHGWIGLDWTKVLNPAPEPKRWARMKHYKGEVRPIDFPLIKYQMMQPWFLEEPGKKLLYPKDLMFDDGKRNANYENLLDEVTIIAKRKWRGEGFADIYMNANDVANSGAQNLYMLIRQKLPGSKIEPYSNFYGSSYRLYWKNRYLQIVLPDDSLPDPYYPSSATRQRLKQRMMDYRIDTCSMIEIMYSESYTNKYEKIKPPQNFSPGNKLRMMTRNPFPPPRLNILTPAFVRLSSFLKKEPHEDPKLIVTPRKYYQPRYLPGDVRLDNERTTVHWEPNIVTNEEGKAIVSFFTSDAKGTYSLNLQGADFAGKLGSTFKNLIIR